jgi:hypothetical protein
MPGRMTAVSGSNIEALQPPKMIEPRQRSSIHPKPLVGDIKT